MKDEIDDPNGSPQADEAALDYIATRIAPQFGVSAEVIANGFAWKSYGHQINNSRQSRN